MKKLFLVLMVCLINYSCATKYQPRMWKGGFESTQLGEDMYRVTFIGNGYTSSTKAQDYCLLRCAELTIENGYKYFVIISEDNYSSNSKYTTPVTTNSNYNVSSNYSGYNVRGTSYSYGGQTYNISKPRSKNTILMLKEKDSNNIVYEASFLIQSLKSKYKIY
tara:strand:- start:230 stop:718 length:489 start_codon:yes stop_codon:yes gene_type:complete